MKKVLIAIVTFLYVASTSGATLHFHYCMGRLVETALHHDDQDKCGKCGMDKKKSTNSCCKDVHQFVKVDQAHVMSTFDFQALALTVDVLPVQAYHVIVPASEVLVKNTPPTGPPLCISDQPLFLRHRNFRI